MTKEKTINLSSETGRIVSPETAKEARERVTAVKMMHRFTKIFNEARKGRDVSARLAKLSEDEKVDLLNILGSLVSQLQDNE